MSTHNTSAALRKCRGCGKVYAEDAPHPCTGGSDPYTAGMTIEEARRIYGSTDGKSPGVKAAEEADRVQLVEALAEHPGTPWGEAIEKVATLRLEHDAWGAVIDGLRARLATVTRERDEARDHLAPYLAHEAARADLMAKTKARAQELAAAGQLPSETPEEALTFDRARLDEARAVADVLYQERDELRAALETIRADHTLLVQALLTTVKTLRDPRLAVSEGVVDGIVAGIKEATGMDVDAALAGGKS